MLGSVKDATAGFGDQVEVVEYKFTKPENVARVVKMGITNLPSVYINGALKYSSVIPDRSELVDVIKKLL
jgi:uroporphyrinogen decarboxylase